MNDLSHLALKEGLPLFRAKQMAWWLYKSDIPSVHGMTNLPKAAREIFSNHYEWGKTPFIKESLSSDGTRKYLFPTQKGHRIESAWIPDKERSTLCLSTQAGCKWGCRFCMTGTMGFLEDLSVSDILNQLASLPNKDKVTNLVFMGMGEPLDNIDNLLKSLEILTFPWGYAMSPRRITVSTVGIIPGLVRFLEESECHLAYSLHNPFPEERARMMPVEKKYPLREIISLIKEKKDLFKGQRRFTVEYTLMDGENDSLRHARELVRLLNGLRTRVNLITYNGGTGLPWKGVSSGRALEFREALNQKGLVATIRNSRGGDIEAACGLLSINNSVSSVGID